MDTQQQMVDEISLMDIALIFKKHKKLFWGVVGLFVCLAVALALVKSKHYNFSQKFRLAHYYSGSTMKIVVDLNDVLIDLNTRVIPAVLASYNRKNNQHLTSKSLPASIVEYSPESDKDKKIFSRTLIQLSINGKVSMLPVYQQLFNQIHKQIVQIEAAKLNYFKKVNVFQLQLQQKALLDYQNDFASLDLKLEKNPIMTKKQLGQGQSVAVSSEAIGVQSLARIQELMTYRQMLTYRVSIQSKIESLEASIQSAKSNLSTLSVMAPISSNTASTETVGLTKTALFFLVCLFGFFTALIAVFFAEFRQKLKQQNAQ